METFMSLMSKIEDILDKENDLNKRAGSLIADALLNRVQTNGIDKSGAATKKDIMNAIKNFPPEVRETILIEALIAYALKSSTGVTPQKKSSKKRESSFSW